MAHLIRFRRKEIFCAFSIVVLAVSLPGLASSAEMQGKPSGVVVTLSPIDGSTFVREITADAFSSLPPGLLAETGGAPRPTATEKLYPLLVEEIRLSPPDQAIEIVITFRDRLRIPRFPKPVTGEAPNSPANQAALAAAARLVEQVRAARQPVYSARAKSLSALGVEVMETFWLIDAMRVRMPLWAIEELAEDPEVLYIEPNQSTTPPPDSNLNNDVADARAYIRTDSLANLATGGFVGLLDSGVRTTHTLFNNPSPFRYVRDCVNGTQNNCTTGNDLNPDDICNHGTSTAAIITGNANLGNDYRGVDWVTLDSFRVYPTTCQLDHSAAVRGFQAAVAVLDQVIVAEMQGLGSDSSSISLAADNAYDAGAIVVAANGNFGPSDGTVRAPANAHKVLGIGAFDVQTLAQYPGQSRGPAPDGRIKPDLQAPTNSETASSASPTALRVFTGTSGATPYASGLAIGLRNWIARTGAASFLPGIGYAWMILMGQNNFPFDNILGAGHARFVPNGLIFSGKAVFTGGPAQFDAPLDGFGMEPQFPYNLTAAIWWPEAVTDAHNDVDLFIVDPGGVIRASSTSVASVFEHTQVPGLLAAGTWKLRIQNKGSRSQEVFFGAYRTSS